MSRIPTLGRVPRLAAFALAFTAVAGGAEAHVQSGVAGGLLSGVLHPLTGIDHMAAMVAVGIWGAQLGAPAIWLLPICFPLLMAVGGALGVAGVPLPATELGIALSALLLGGLVAFRQRAPLWGAAALVGVFALFHGHAHGVELPNAANPLAYGIGFVTSTGLLHLCGILLGVALRWRIGAWLVQGVGAAIAALGVAFLYSAMVGA